MTIQLSKNKSFDAVHQKFRVRLKWSPNADPGAPLYDLDLAAFLLAGNAQIPTQEHFVFYNNPESPDGAVKLCGDDRVGGFSESDGEALEIDCSQLELSIQQIYFAASIHEAAQRGQNFGMTRDAQVSIEDLSSNEELCHYDLPEDFAPACAVEFGRLYASGNEWRFEPLGNQVAGGLQALVHRYAKRFA